MRDARVARVRVAAVAALFVAAACSSTAQDLRPEAATAPPSPLAAVGATPEPFKGASDVAGSTTPEPQKRHPQPTAGVSRGAASASATAAEEYVAAAPPASPAAVEASRRAPTGPGVSRDTISFGVRIPRNGWSPSTFGLEPAESLTPSERKEMHRVLAAAVNSAGGILGRSVRPVFWEFDTRDYSSFAEAQQAACEYFTREESVFALLGAGLDGLTECMERNGRVTYQPSFTAFDLVLYRRYRHVVGAAAMSLDRQAALYIAGLDAQGFFGARDRVGLVTWDDPVYARVVDRVVYPALTRIGVELAADARVRPPKDEAGYPQAVSEAQTVVERFKSEGINKVLALDHTGSGLQVFMNLAEARDYRPKYGLYSLTGGGQALKAKARKQLHGALGVGWIPLQDIDLEAGLRAAPEATGRCRRLMEANDLDLFDDYLSAQMAATACDFWLFLKAAIEAGGPAVTADSAVAGAESLGASFSPAMTFASRFGPGRRDGVAAVRYFRFFTRCDCFRYTSGLYNAL